MSQLAANVHVRHPDGYTIELPPGVPVPNWAVPLITNPKAWAGGQLPEAPSTGDGQGGASGPQDSDPTTSAIAEDVADPGETAQEDAAEAKSKVPPRGGAGSGRDVWAAYAADHGVEVTEEMRSREDIISALTAAGVPVE